MLRRLHALPLLSLLQTHSLTGGKCVLLASGSKCKTTLPYWQYCEWLAESTVRCAARSTSTLRASWLLLAAAAACMPTGQPHVRPRWHAHPPPALSPCPIGAGAQCDATGTKCLSCNGSRSPPTGVTDGRCALPCKQLFGIGCKTCNQTKCLTTDPKYAQGAGCEGCSSTSAWVSWFGCPNTERLDDEALACQSGLMGGSARQADAFI